MRNHNQKREPLVVGWNYTPRPQATQDIERLEETIEELRAEVRELARLFREKVHETT